MALLCKHIPGRYDRRKSLWDDRRKSLWDEQRSRSPFLGPARRERGKSLWDEHLVRYVDWYSNQGVVGSNPARRTKHSAGMCSVGRAFRKPACAARETVEGTPDFSVE